MIRIEKALVSVRQSVTRLMSKCISEPGRQAAPNATPIQPTSVREVAATVAVTTKVAQVFKFSHGSGLLVYINGRLMSAARVALQVNIATLEFIERLHVRLEALSTTGVCLGAAFADVGQRVDVAWAEVGSETERDWREAERAWEEFSGGPYEAFELEDYCNEELFLRRNLWRVQFGEHNSRHEEELAASPEDQTHPESSGMIRHRKWRLSSFALNHQAECTKSWATAKTTRTHAQALISNELGLMPCRITR